MMKTPKSGLALVQFLYCRIYGGNNYVKITPSLNRDLCTYHTV